MLQCFQQNNINTFDVLAFIEMRAILTDKKFTSENDYTHKKCCLWAGLAASWVVAS